MSNTQKGSKKTTSRRKSSRTPPKTTKAQAEKPALPDTSADDAEPDTHKDTPNTSRPKPATQIRVVGLGASAGGLEPLERFFEAAPENTGVAYVVVQHLSPDFKSMMPELLERHSDLPIRPITDSMPIEPNTIYLAPPRSSLEIKGNALHLREQDVSYEFNLPINYMFESLAREYGPNAIAVVLSGTGSDGTLGAEAIAAAGGTVIAQDPATAKFDSMPRSVIHAVQSSIYAAPDKLPALVSAAIEGAKMGMSPPPLPVNLNAPEREIVRQLQVRYGLDFGYYKTSTVGRRISRRAKLAKFQDVGDYAAALSRDPEELEELYADLLIGVTAFLRDRAAFDSLAINAIPRLAKRMAEGHEIRVWTPGCASGEEPFSIAMLLAERARILGVDLKLKIFATDIHPRSLRFASRGIYKRETLASMPPELRDRYFTEAGDSFQIVNSLREYVVFSKHNLINDPPFTRMDMVSCRNLLIYFDDEAQRKAVAMFHFALRKDGVLFLGPSETLGGLSDEFDPIDSRWRIFSKRRDIRLVEATRLLPLTSGHTYASRIGKDAAPTDLTSPIPLAMGTRRRSMLHIYDSVLSKALGSSILAARNGDILHLFGDSAKFLKLRQGQFSRKVQDLFEDPLKMVILAGLERIRKSTDTEFSRIVELPSTDEGTDEAPGKTIRVSVTVVDTGEAAEDMPVLVSLTPIPQDVVQPTIDRDLQQGALREGQEIHARRIAELERDLRYSEEALQTTVEELETANEELQATNEELQATNEELMASNEELQTVNEELHAVNEELYTVSAEHQSKISELTNLSSDLDNLLQSIEIGVLFLDSEMNIRRVTRSVADIFNILPRDLGRPLTHVTRRFEFDNLAETISTVMVTGLPVERNIAVDGFDYLLRILPYRTPDEINGTVLTFVDVTEMARANRSLQQFADVVSHDLKAPLRAIRTTANWIVEDLGDDVPKDIKNYSDKLVLQIDRLAQMLTDLGDFSNLSRQNGKVEFFNSGDVFDEIINFFDAAELKLTKATPLPDLETNRAAFRLVMQNIVDNAVKHNRQKQSTVTISATENAGVWTFKIEDDGPGIDPRFHDKIFLPFRKLKPAVSSPGSGIGLALVKKTIDEYGGIIQIESDPAQGPGTTFLITWPETDHSGD